MTRPISALIDSQALRHNLAVIRTHAGQRHIMAVVKANAYGHGLQVVMAGLQNSDALAVASVEEAVQLRQLGWCKPILLLEGVFDAYDMPYCLNHQLSMVIHRPEQLRMVQLTKLNQPLNVFVKLNSGMNRLGFSPSEYSQTFNSLRHSSMLSMTQMSHFANADEPAGIAAQMAVIQPIFASFPYPVSLANSAALLRYPVSHGDWLRPGIALYGASPFTDISATTLDLQPVMTLRSRIIALQTVPAGQGVGYGHGWVATQTTRVGIVACGYADGYPRHAGTGTPILVDGQMTRTLGHVSMDMLAVDLTPCQQAGVGSPVILWGRGLPVEHVAQAAGTISYELLCARAQRVPEQVV